jgi:hypothetical protein
MAAAAEAAPVSAPMLSADTPCGRRRPAGAMAASSWPSAISSSIAPRGAVHSIATPAPPPHRGQQVGEQRQREVGGGEAEDAGRRRRIEAPARRHHALQAPQDRARLLEEGQGEGCRLHAARAFDEQRVAKLPAQAAQGMAHGRLCAAQPLGSAGDAAFGNQHVEHDQQVEVEAVKIDFAHVQ